MKRFLVFSLVLAALAVGFETASGQPAGRVFQAELSGDQEVPPLSVSGSGRAQFVLSPAGDALRYQLIVRNTPDITQAHIHIAEASENGPVVTFLFGFVEDGVTKNGLLARGTITEDDLIERDGFGATMAELIDRLERGAAYVNVHTVAHPPGEIRGQIHPAGR